jgi:hypothetical protein
MRRKIGSNSNVVTTALYLGKPAEGKECGKAQQDRREPEAVDGNRDEFDQDRETVCDNKD